MLLSVIATQWVKRALEKGEPPLTMASSATNQAVTNILEAFFKVKERDGALAGRWLDEIKSYGLYLPAFSRTDTFEFPVQELKATKDGFVFDAKKYENKADLEQARKKFLSHAQAALDLADGATLQNALDALHDKIAQAVQKTKGAILAVHELLALCGSENLSSADINACADRLASQKELSGQEQAICAERAVGLRWIRAQWAEHQAQEPWWMGLLSTIGLSAQRKARDRAFCARTASTHDHLVGDSFAELAGRLQVEQFIAAVVAQAKQEEAQASERLSEADRQVRQLAALTHAVRDVLGGGEPTVEAVQSALDLGPRYEAFKLATHYWEGRYLQFVGQALQAQDEIPNKKSPEKLRALYRRLAMLHPCFVATLFTLPDRMTAWLGKEIPLLEEIDLLIIDEAGQVPPEIGVPAFALAKQAVVVGDVDQIEPVWSVPMPIDAANAVHSAVASQDTLEAFFDSGISSSSGSLMRVAQRAMVFAKHPERGRGMFLSEHRRCWTEIISICNALVYGGRLRPMREEDGPRKITPSLGFVHIPGEETSQGGSRQNKIEAEAIAQWIALRREDLEAAYPKKPLGKIIAVVTPFCAQKRAVNDKLNEALGKKHGITVGTVHALQGAEYPVVIFSPTYDQRVVPGQTFMDRNRSILNVAISRAQDAFLVFGNMRVFQPQGANPCAVVGKMLFASGEEITGVPARLLTPLKGIHETRLYSSLPEHQDVLKEAIRTAKRTLVIVSPFVKESAMHADDVCAEISKAVARNVKVRVVSDAGLNKEDDNFHRCVAALEQAGAGVRLAEKQGVHSKVLLVDRSWLVVGSFNWLSAVRNPANKWSRYESSMRYDGSEAFVMIEKTLRDLKDILDAR
ncbi:hypothetical protein bcgnr5380_58010 [Bacillus cereus]